MEPPNEPGISWSYQWIAECPRCEHVAQPEEIPCPRCGRRLYGFLDLKIYKTPQAAGEIRCPNCKHHTIILECPKCFTAISGDKIKLKYTQSRLIASIILFPFMLFIGLPIYLIAAVLTLGMINGKISNFMENMFGRIALACLPTFEGYIELCNPERRPYYRRADIEDRKDELR